MRSVGLVALGCVVLVAPARAGGDEAKKWVAQLASKDEAKVQAALEGLAALNREGLPHLCSALDDARVTVRLGALRQLARLGDIAAEALPKLAEHGARLATSDAATLSRALFDAAVVAGIESRINPLMLIAAEPGMNELDRKDADRVLEARVTTQVLAVLGKHAPLRLFELVSAAPRATAPNDFSVPRVALVIALRQILEAASEDQTRSLAGVVVQGAHSESLDARVTALAAAAAFEDAPEELETVVESALSSGEARERAMACAVIAQWPADCERRGGALAALFADTLAYPRLFAAAAARRHCGPSPEGERVMLAALADADTETRIAAIEILNGMGFRPPARAAELLGECLKSRSERLLVAACDALAVLGDQAAAVEPHIAALTKHKSFQVRRAAERAHQRVR
ncbi:MAG: HEAT repeat domain-containing protein [Planctomycetes bacterium]|nr:HEAT repeat domain-containing protein [Planctomycetota bacterium]